MIRRKLLHLLTGAIALLSLAAILPGQPTEASDTSGKRWWERVQYLASDQMEGRLTGSEGYRRAAQYVAEQFKKFGIQPAGTDGYDQPVKFDVQRVLAADSKLTLQSGGTSEALQLREDAILGSRLAQPATLTAALIFVGYGLHIPESNFDDFSGLDLRGKVAVFVNGGPGDISGALKANARSAQEFIRVLEDRGAVGYITIPNPKSMDIPWSRMTLAASQPGMRLDDPHLEDSRGPLFTAIVNPAHADKLFAGSGHTIGELLALADAGKPLPHFPMPSTLKATVTTANETVESPNVIGVLPGTDPQLKHEYVVYSAHLDHLGIGEPISGDKIYNGAMDNASGVASLLEIAESLHEAHTPLKRSVLFVVVCAEEKGLLGSRYFAAKPTVPKHEMVADLNVDMFLPLYPLNYLVVYGADESTLGDDIKAVSAKLDVQIIPDRHPDRNVFIRSDQYNFIRAGIPSLMPAFGSKAESLQEKTQMEWLQNRYHAPSDDLDQPVDLAAAAKFNRLMLNLIARIANQETRPQWNTNSFFRRFASPTN